VQLPKKSGIPVEPDPEAQYHPFVIRRLYVHNFRCLENFELPISGHSSVLLIGKNGSGKTSVSHALEVLQKIARGTSEVDKLVKPKDLARGRTDVPMRFEIQIELDSTIYEYVIAFKSAEGLKELYVFEERLSAGGKILYARGLPARLSQMTETFYVDRRFVALPIAQQLPNTPLPLFRQWLARMLILRPIPSLIHGDSEEESLEPNPDVTNFAAWFSALTGQYPAAYAKIDEYLKQVMRDLKDIQNPMIGKDARSLIVQFSNDLGNLKLSFEDLSDGEKCFMICALVLAANNAYGPLLCFWDEPDNHLAPDEVGHFVLALRKAFQSGGQFIATSHNPEAIRQFSDENTLVLYRKSHLEPTIVRPLSEIQVSGDLVNALIRGDVEP
jgi:ABC-type multidrug transport system ATPase subunit